MRNGYGLLRFTESSYYKGNWKNNMFHGSGEQNWGGGKRFLGEYKLNKI